MVQRAGDLFSQLFKSFDAEQMQQADEYSALINNWKDIVEKNGIAAAAAHSRITTVDKGLVWIEVDHPGWKQILQAKESKLLYDFNYRFPKMGISGISIMLGRKGSWNREQVADSIEPVVSEQAAGSGARSGAECAKERAAELPAVDSSDYEAIKDPVLKEVLMRLEQNIREREGRNGA